MSKEKNTEDSKAGVGFFDQMLASGTADQEMIHDIITVFIQETEEGLRQMHQALMKEDGDTIRRYAHKMKPSFVMFDLQEQHRIVRAFEQGEMNYATTTRVQLAQLISSCQRDFQWIKEKYNLTLPDGLSNGLDLV